MPDLPPEMESSDTAMATVDTSDDASTAGTSSYNCQSTSDMATTIESNSTTSAATNQSEPASYR